MDVDRLRVVLETDLSPFQRGLKKAVSDVKSFGSDVTKVGTTAEKSSQQGEKAFSRLSSAIKGVRSEAAKGANFETKADTSFAGRLKSVFTGIRQDASKGADFNVNLNQGRLGELRGVFSGLRQEAAQGATFNVGLNQGRLGELRNVFADVRSDAAQGATFNLDADSSGLTGASSQLDALKASAMGSSTYTVNADFDGAGAVAGFMAFRGAAGGATTVGEAFDAMTSRLVAGAGLLAPAIAAAAASIVPLLGGLAVVGGLGASAGAGLGLMAGAVYVLKEGLYDGGVAADTLAAKWDSLGSQMATALGPASINIAEVGYAAMETAEMYIPLLGQVATDTSLEMQHAFNQFFLWLRGEAGAGFMQEILGETPTILGNLTGAVTRFGEGLIAVFAAAAPYASQLSEFILGIATSFSQWAQSAEGQEQITAAIETAIPVFQALWDAAVNIVGALLRFSQEAGPDLATAISILGTGIGGLIDGFTRLYDAAGYVGDLLGGLPETIDNFLASLPEESLLDRVTGVGQGDPSILPNLQALWSEADGYLANLAPNVTLLDVITGNASMSDADSGIVWLLAKLGEMWTASGEWLAGLSPEISLLDVIMGNASASDADTGLASLLPGLEAAWLGVSEWINGLVPEVSLLDVIMGNASADDAESGLASLLPGLMTAWEEITGWLGSLFPEVTLMDVILGNASADEAESGLASLLPGLIAAWEGIAEWLNGLVPEVTLMDVIMGNASADEAETGLASLLPGLMAAWESITGWLSSLMPEVTLMDVIMGNASAEDAESGIASLLPSLEAIWAGITEWIAGLVPEVSLLDVIMGNANAEDADSGLATIIPMLQELWTQVVEIWESIKTSVSDAMSYIWNDVIVYYWDSITTSISDALNYIWNDVIVSTWESIKTSVYDAMNYIWNDVIVTIWESIKTSVYDAMQYIWNDVIVATWESIKTSVYDAMNYIWNDVIVTIWESIKTAVYDAMQYIWNDIIVATWESIKTAVYDAMTYLWNDVIVPIWEDIKTAVSDAMAAIETSVSDAWTAIVDGVAGFAQSFYDAVYNGFWEAVSAGGEALASLLDAVSGALTAINDPLGIAGTLSSAAETIRGLTAFASGGLAIEAYASGGLGTPGANGKLHYWNEQQGNEAFIAERGPRQQNLGYLATAASWYGMGLTPHAEGGVSSACSSGACKTRSFAKGGLSSTAEVGGEGLGPTTYNWDSDVQSIVDGIDAAMPHSDFSRNTYTNHPGGEGRSVDYWGGAGRGTQVPMDIGDAVYDLAWGEYLSDLTYTMWQGVYEDTGGYNYTSGDHYDHIHATFGSEDWGIGAKICSLAETAKGKFTKAAEGLADKAKESLTALDMPIVESVGVTAIESIEAKIKEIIAKLPGCSKSGSVGSSGSGGDNASNLELGKQLAADYGWEGEQWAALEELWHRESNWDHTAENPSSGAYGIPQALGHGDIGSDAGSQIAWGLDYISGRYGDPVSALQFHDANGWYEEGGLAVGVGTELDAAEISALEDSVRFPVGDALTAAGALPDAPEGSTWFEDYTAGAPLAAPRAFQYGGATDESGWPAVGETIPYANQSAYADLVNQAVGIWNAAGGPQLVESASPQWTIMDADTGGYGGLANPDGTIYLDPAAMASSDAGDQLSIIVHELGHAYGLIDNPGGYSIMNYDQIYELDGQITDEDIAAIGGTGVAPTTPGTTGTPGGSGGGGGTGSTSTFSDRVTKAEIYKDQQNTGNVNPFHNGGIVPGLGDALAMVEGGERVLPRNLNRGFEDMAQAIGSWSAAGGSKRFGSIGDDSANLADRLEAIETAVINGAENPTPVNVNNPETLKSAFVAGALAAQMSDAGAEITDNQVAGGIRYMRQMMGERT